MTRRCCFLASSAALLLALLLGSLAFADAGRALRSEDDPSEEPPISSEGASFEDLTSDVREHLVEAGWIDICIIVWHVSLAFTLFGFVILHVC